VPGVRDPLSDPLRFGAVVRRVRDGYRHDWKLLLLVGLAVFIPVGAIAALRPLEGYSLDDWSGGWAAVLVAIIVGQAVLPLLGAVFYSGVVAAGVEEREHGTSHGIGHVARSLPYWTLILADLALVLALGFGFLALIVPGFIFSVWFSLIAPVIEIERLGVRRAFRRSRELVRPYFWKVAGVMVPLTILQGSLEGAGDGVAHGILGENFLGNWLGEIVANLLGAPLYALTVLALYFEIRSREAGSAVGQSSTDG
jgi:hypothetical protein